MLKIVNSNHWQEMRSKIVIQAREIANLHAQITHLRKKLDENTPHRNAQGRFAKKAE